MAEQKKDTKTPGLEVAVNFLSNMMDRYTKIDDPAMKFTLFIDHLQLGLDLAKAFADSDCFNEGSSEIVKLKTKDTIDRLIAEFQGLAEWIKHPCYGPDHPYGKQIMNTAQVDFKEKEKSLEEPKK